MKMKIILILLGILTLFTVTNAQQIDSLAEATVIQPTDLIVVETTAGTRKMTWDNLLSAIVDITNKVHYNSDGTITIASSNDTVYVNSDFLTAIKVSGEDKVDGAKIDANSIPASSLKDNEIDSTKINDNGLVGGNIKDYYKRHSNYIHDRNDEYQIYDDEYIIGKYVYKTLGNLLDATNFNSTPYIDVAPGDSVSITAYVNGNIGVCGYTRYNHYVTAIIKDSAGTVTWTGVIPDSVYKIRGTYNVNQEKFKLIFHERGYNKNYILSEIENSKYDETETTNIFYKEHPNLFDKRAADLQKREIFDVINLFDMDERYDSTNISSGGIYVSHPNLFSSYLIPITEGRNYYKYSNEPWAFLDNELNVVQYLNGGVTDNYTAPVGSKYVVITELMSNLERAYLYEDDDYNGTYIAHREQIKHENDYMEITLEDEVELYNNGGSIYRGALGDDAVFKIPIVIEDRKATIKFTGVMPFDISNPTTSQRFLFELETNSSSARIRLNNNKPDVDYYVPDYSASPTVTFYTKNSNIGAKVYYDLDNHGYPFDCFSVRRLDNDSSHLDISMKVVPDTGLTIYQADSTLHFYDFSTYTVVDSLINQMQDELSDYEIVRYKSAGVLTSELQYLDVKIVKEHSLVDYSTGDSTGETIYDSYETFVSKSMIGEEWTFKITIEPDTLTNKAIFTFFINGMPCWWESDDMTNYEDGYIYVGGQEASHTDDFGGVVKNLKVHPSIEREPYINFMTGHYVVDGQEYNGSIPPGEHELTTTYGRIERVLKYCKANDIKLIGLNDAIEMLHGNIEQPKKSALFVFDDTNIDYYDIQRVRELFLNYNAKPVVNVIINDSIPSTKLDKIKLMRQYGWEVAIHAHYHVGVNNYSYEQLIGAIDTSRSYLESNGILTQAWVYAGGNTNLAAMKVLRNHGIAIALRGGRGATYPGSNLMRVNRGTLEDRFDFDTSVKPFLNGKYPTIGP